MPKKFEEMVKSIKKSCKKSGKQETVCNKIAYGTATNYYKKHGKNFKNE